MASGLGMKDPPAPEQSFALDPPTDRLAMSRQATRKRSMSHQDSFRPRGYFAANHSKTVPKNLTNRHTAWKNKSADLTAIGRTVSYFAQK